MGENEDEYCYKNILGRLNDCKACFTVPTFPNLMSNSLSCFSSHVIIQYFMVNTIPNDAIDKTFRMLRNAIHVVEKC